MFFTPLIKLILGLVSLLTPALLSAETLYLKENPDAPLCQYSAIFPAQGAAFSYKKRTLRTSNADILRLYQQKYATDAQNFNSLTLNRLVKAYGFSEKRLREAAKVFEYKRNAFERYAYIRLLIRQKIEHIILGMHDVLEYSRINPLEHEDIVKGRLGFFAKKNILLNQHDQESPYHAFFSIPSLCSREDPYIAQLVQHLSRKMRNQQLQLNKVPITNEKIHKSLSSDAPIYSIEKNIAITSLQETLRKAFLSIKTLKKFKNKIENQDTQELDIFKYYLSNKSRLRVLQTLQSEELVKKHITKNREYAPWLIYLNILFASENQRQKILKIHGKNQLAQAVATLPHGSVMSEDSWQKAFAYLKRKAQEAQDEMDMLKITHPLLSIDYKRGLGKETLFSWLSSNTKELKVTDLTEYSANFDFEIQKALAFNFVHKQLPALKRTCQLLKMTPDQLICPAQKMTIKAEIKKILLDNPQADEVLKEEGHLHEAASNFIIDQHITTGKQLFWGGLELAGITVATLATYPVVSTLLGRAPLFLLAGSTKWAQAMRATNIMRVLRITKIRSQLFTRAGGVHEIAGIAKTGLHQYLFYHSIYATYQAYEQALIAEENAHTVITGRAWGGLKAVENAWHNFTLSAGLLMLNGTLSKMQLTRLWQESVVIKNGIAYTKAKTPKIILQTLKSAGVEVKKFSTYQSAVFITDKLRLTSEAFKRTIAKNGAFIDAGKKRGRVEAEVISNKSSVHYRAINTLRVSQASEHVPAGAALLKGGTVVDDFALLNNTQGIKFLHKKSGDIFELSQKIFQIVNRSGEYSVKIKSGAAWFGVQQGLASVAIGTHSTGYALFLRGVKIPKSALKRLGSLIGGGIKLAVGGTIVAAAGITLFLESSVNKFIIGAADQLRDLVPPHWEKTHENIAELITRLGPKAINQVERQAKIREFTIKTHVRSVLDYFQDKTNQLEDKLTSFDQFKWYIDGLLREIAVAKTATEKENYIIQLRGFIERMDYYTHRFEQWLANVQRNINYNAEWYTFYDENQTLFDHYWDHFYSVRKDIGFANEFSKECNKDSCVLRYGIWVASFPPTGEQTSELLALKERARQAKLQMQEYKKLALEKFNITTLAIPSGVMEPMAQDQFSKSLRKIQSTEIADATGLAHYIVSIESELADKQRRLDEQVGHFSILFDKIMSENLNEVEKKDLKNKIIKVLAAIYTLNIRDFYQWKNHVKSVLDGRLYQIMLMEKEQRDVFISSMNDYTKNTIVIEEIENVNKMMRPQQEERIGLRLKFGHWYIATGKYDETMQMKELEVNFYKKLREIEKYILLLKKVNLLPAMTKEELTSFNE